MKALLIIIALLAVGCITTEPVDINEPLVGPAADVVGACKMVVGNSVWAVAQFPGKTADQLASVRAMGHAAAGEPRGAPPGYEYAQLAVFVRNEEVAVNCDAGPVTLPAYDYVIFSAP